MDKLAKALGLSAAETRQAWESADLDGDERFSIAARFGIDYEGPGQNGNAEFSRGMAKFKAKKKKLTTKRLYDRS
jgi:hypothetical protein